MRIVIKGSPSLPVICEQSTYRGRKQRSKGCANVQGRAEISLFLQLASCSDVQAQCEFQGPKGEAADMHLCGAVYLTKLKQGCVGRMKKMKFWVSTQSCYLKYCDNHYIFQRVILYTSGYCQQMQTNCFKAFPLARSSGGWKGTPEWRWRVLRASSHHWYNLYLRMHLYIFMLLRLNLRRKQTL